MPHFPARIIKDKNVLEDWILDIKMKLMFQMRS